jgi:hypothetical protein
MMVIPDMASARGLRLPDAVVLIAAPAGALALFRPYYAALGPLRWGPPIGPAPPTTGWIWGSWGCLVRASPLVMAWTLAILVLRLRRPRPLWARLVRQPGLVAGLMAALVLIWRLLGFATLCARVLGDPGLAAWLPRHFDGRGCFIGGNPGWLLFDTDNFLNTMALIGTAVASAWILMFVSGRWRPERSWIDRAGRILGSFWIACLPLTSW